jgi:hypothetical protein
MYRTVELSRRSVARDLVFVLQDVNVVAGCKSGATLKRSALMIYSTSYFTTALSGK